MTELGGVAVVEVLVEVSLRLEVLVAGRALPLVVPAPRRLMSRGARTHARCSHLCCFFNASWSSKIPFPAPNGQFGPNNKLALSREGSAWLPPASP